MEALVQRLEASLLVGGALTAGGLFVGQRGVRWLRHGVGDTVDAVTTALLPPPHYMYGVDRSSFLGRIVLPVVVRSCLALLLRHG
jgi:hypothetical protein